MEREESHQPAANCSLPTTYTPEATADLIVNSLVQVARLVHTGFFTDFGEVLPWQGNQVKDLLDWFKWSREFADQTKLTGPAMKNSLEAKMKVLGTTFIPSFPVPFDLHFLQVALDHFIEVMVMNTSVSNDVFTQLLDAVETGYSDLVTTSFCKKEVVLNYRTEEKAVFRHVDAWKELYNLKHLDRSENEQFVENYVLALVEKLVLWLESFHQSAWFQLKLAKVLCCLCGYKRGWDIILSCLVTNLGRFEQPLRPVVRRLLDYMVTWIVGKSNVDGLDCEVWCVDAWRVARAAEFNASFLRFYLVILDEMVKSLGNIDPGTKSSFVQREDFKKVLLRFYYLLCMEDCIKGQVLYFLNSKCDLSMNDESSAFIWATLNQELSARFICDR